MKNNCTERKAAASIYREAARLIEIEEEHYGCCAIAAAKGRTHYEPLCNAMRDLYRDAANGDGIRTFWLTPIGDSYEEQKNGRILALCFMAAMVEAGDA